MLAVYDGDERIAVLKSVNSTNIGAVLQ